MREQLPEFLLGLRSINTLATKGAQDNNHKPGYGSKPWNLAGWENMASDRHTQVNPQQIPPSSYNHTQSCIDTQIICLWLRTTDANPLSLRSDWKKMETEAWIGEFLRHSPSRDLCLEGVAHFDV